MAKDSNSEETKKTKPKQPKSKPKSVKKAVSSSASKQKAGEKKISSNSDQKTDQKSSVKKAKRTAKKVSGTQAQGKNKTTVKSQIKKSFPTLKSPATKKTSTEQSGKKTTIPQKPEEKIRKNKSSTVGQVKRKRTPRTDTISQIYYRQISKRLFTQNICNVFVLFFLAAIAAYCIFYFAKHRGGESEILRLASTGLHALQQEQSKMAEAYFSKALELYKNFHADNPQKWWHSDSLLFTNMLRVGQGWRSLGNYEMALETFRQVSLHNSEGPDSWVGDNLNEELIVFIDSDHWSDQYIKEIYEYLLPMDPKTWETGDIFQVQVTERAGLHRVPMKERYDSAEVVIYGIPKPESEDDAFAVEGKTFYKIDRLPGQFRINYPNFSPDLKERLLWYINQGRHCLIFGKNVDEQNNEAVITRIEDILLSEIYSVEAFNQVLDE